MAEERSPMKNTMENMSLKQALSRLETIVAELEEGRLSLDESMARFEEGVRLAYLCLQRLEEEEKQENMMFRVEPEGDAPT
jgi:exodeoxyribonuclease VII small subunit